MAPYRSMNGWLPVSAFGSNERIKVLLRGGIDTMTVDLGSGQR